MENASSFLIFRPQDLQFQCYIRGPMWTTCTTHTFVLKLWNPLMITLLKCSSFKIGLDSLPYILPHLWECAWVLGHFSYLLQLSYFNFNCKPKATVTTLEINFHYFFSFSKFLLFFCVYRQMIFNFFPKCLFFILHSWTLQLFRFHLFCFHFKRLCHIQYS
jgi:hypothetical protein